MKKYRAFLGLSPPHGLIFRWREIEKKFFDTTFFELQPWYKLHLTIYFWPNLNRREFFFILDFLRKSSLNEVRKTFSKIEGIGNFGNGRVVYFKEISEEVFMLRQKVEKTILELPENLQGEKGRSFTPHWTIIRNVKNFKKAEKLLKELENFSHEGTSPTLEFYFSARGIYEPHSLQLSPPSKSQSLPQPN